MIICAMFLQGLKQKVAESVRAGILSDKEAELAVQGQEKLFPQGIPECGTDALRFTLLSHNTKSKISTVSDHPTISPFYPPAPYTS